MKKSKHYLSEALDALYILEDRLSYDETKAGKKVGKCINKLQTLLGKVK